MNEVDLMHLLDRLTQAKGASLLREAGPAWTPTPECPPLPRLSRGERSGDWSPAERKHFTTCAYCRMSLALAGRLATPVLRVVLLLRPTAQGQWRPASVKGPTSRASPEQSPPPSGSSWSLENPEGQATLSLPDTLAEFYYGDPTINQLRLWLHVGRTPGKESCPELEVLPGPTRNPMTVDVTFPTGERRTMLVETEPTGGLRKGRSTAGEPLPPALLEPQGELAPQGGGARSAEVCIELR